MDPEALDEAVAAKATVQLRADRRRWAAQHQATLSASAQKRAQASTLASQAGAVRAPSAQGKIAAIRPTDGAPRVTAMLPNGRKVELRMQPVLATHAQVVAFRRTSNHNNAATRRALDGAAAATRRLAALQAKSVRTLSQQAQNGDQAIGKRIASTQTTLVARAQALGVTSARRLDAQNTQAEKAALRRIRSAANRARWDKLLLASALPLFAAYGNSQDLLARENLTLAGVLVGLLIGDDLILRLMGKNRAARSVAEAWSWLAPLLNLGIGWWLYDGEKVYDRYVTGVTTLSISIPGLEKEPNYPWSSDPVTITITEDMLSRATGVDLKGRPVIVSTTSLTETGAGGGETDGGKVVAFELRGQMTEAKTLTVSASGLRTGGTTLELKVSIAYAIDTQGTATTA